MAKWKLSRQEFGTEEFTVNEGEKVTIGRGLNNTITLSSIVISRNHCELLFEKDKVVIKDLKSSNGIYIGKKKIQQNIPYTLKDSDLIGLGWSRDAPLMKICDSEKYVFKLIKENFVASLIDRLEFQNNNEFDDIESNIAKLDRKCNISLDMHSPILSMKPKLKRKIEENEVKVKTEKDEIYVISDNDTDHDIQNKHDIIVKKPKLEPIEEIQQKQNAKEENHLKIQNEDLLFDAFSVKQEYLGYDGEDDPIIVDSDSDSESQQWMMRLSQSSPGKPFIKVRTDLKSNTNNEDSSYSQIDDDIDDSLINNVDINNDDINEEEYLDDFISIPSQPPAEHTEKSLQIKTTSLENNTSHKYDHLEDSDEFTEDLIFIDRTKLPKTSNATTVGEDQVDGACSDALPKEIVSNAISSADLEKSNEITKKTQMIEPLVHLPKGKKSNFVIESTSKHVSHKSRKGSKHSSSKKHITNSQKEERKKKLKELASKEKGDHDQKLSKDDVNNSNRNIVNAKNSNTNRGAFLTVAVKPTKRKESPHKHKIDHEKDDVSTLNNLENKEINKETINDDIENKKKLLNKHREHKSSKNKDKNSSKSHSKSEKSLQTSSSESRVPLKSLKPLSDCEKSLSGKPCSKVEPLPLEKPKKTVRFSDKEPEVRLFEIEPGNKMKSTSLTKMILIERQKTPVFSLEKITLMKILRWNPQWLNEQINNTEPPPILGHHKPPMSIFHSFTDHKQYVQLVGDLLLMEIWECLTQVYVNTNSRHKEIPMRIESLPPMPCQEGSFELFSFSVNVSLLNAEIRNLPRVGEIMIVSFGPENAKCLRFFFVHNVRRLPSPPNNIHSFFSINLETVFTVRMHCMKPGEVVMGRSLAYINNELMLFEAIEYLAGSPLSEAILRPKSRHFIRNDNYMQNVKSKWTETLNPSQHAAVNSSVSAALGDRPCIQMVQGPPGTGKSAVICAIVMTYFYASGEKKLRNRGKILICATSNAAVDGLVIRLLKIRQSLPKAERFKMVRVGRAEAMHPSAYEVSSQQLAQRDARMHAEPAHAHAGLDEEISYLEAKINMWKTSAQDAGDPVRVAYCQNRVAQLASKIALIRNGGRGGNSEVRQEQVVQAERRIVEGADIIVTTLASAHNHKIRGLKGRIALCIVDEAGQAIEPETLIPLKLDITRLTLIGDPQQLPGYICSQRAKRHGLGESLFGRLTSCAENWPESNPVVLLNQQYRMHKDIADYPNRAFYGGQIITSTPPTVDLGIPPYSIISISSGDKGQGSSGANEMEACAVSRLVRALMPIIRERNLNLAVITPYNGHKELIKNNLKMMQDPSETPVEVNTVDSFQGQERDVVVVSLARSHGVGFLTDAGRMNVMLTRARHALLVCLNPQAMLKHNQWRTLVEDAQKRKLYKVLPNKVCQLLLGGSQVKDDILKYISNR